MQKIVGDFLSGLRLGKHVEYKNLTIFPIILKSESEQEFLTIDEALENNLVEITETSDIGDVPNLRLKNLSDKKLFILDGEELIGAKQNRVTNSVVLVPEREELIIPVSCVERNRWNYKTKRFSSGHSRVYFRLRKKIFQTTINNKERNIRQHPQHDVWTDIDNKMNTMHVDSTTSAMNDIYKKYFNHLEKFNSKIPKMEKQVGMIVMINNKVISCEIFSNSKILNKFHHKILNSYAIDALEESTGRNKKLKTVRRRALSFLNGIKNSNFDEQQSVGLGKDVFYDSDKIYGSALSYNDEIIYMSVYSKMYQ